VVHLLYSIICFACLNSLTNKSPYFIYSIFLRTESAVVIMIFLNGFYLSPILSPSPRSFSFSSSLPK
jgi:hypothetical protein